MAQSSINFQRASSGAFQHNDRTIRPKYLIDDPAKNQLDRTSKQAADLLQQLHSEAAENYRQHFGQKLQAKSYHWEAVINLNKDHDLSDVQELVEQLQKETGFTAVQIAVHLDEGRIERGVKIYNRHAHVNFFTLDRQTGQQLYRRSISKKQQEAQPDIRPMNRERLSALQDLTAHTLGMVRGKRGSEAVRMGHKQYKDAKKQELAKVKDVQQQYAQERTRLKESGQAIQGDYQKLKRMYDELKEQARIKDLTIDMLKTILDEGIGAHEKRLENDLEEERKARLKAEERAEALERDKSPSQPANDRLMHENERLRLDNKHLRSENDAQAQRIEELSQKISRLEEKLRERQPMKERQTNRKEVTEAKKQLSQLDIDQAIEKNMDALKEAFAKPEKSMRERMAESNKRMQKEREEPQPYVRTRERGGRGMGR